MLNKKTGKVAVNKRWARYPLRTCPLCGKVHRCVLLPGEEPAPAKAKGRKVIQ